MLLLDILRKRLAPPSPPPPDPLAGVRLVALPRVLAVAERHWRALSPDERARYQGGYQTFLCVLDGGRLLPLAAAHCRATKAVAAHLAGVVSHAAAMQVLRVMHLAELRYLRGPSEPRLPRTPWIHRHRYPAASEPSN